MKKIFCPHCGTANPANAKFCNHCGYDLSKSKQHVDKINGIERPAEQPKPKTSAESAPIKHTTEKRPETRVEREKPTASQRVTSTWHSQWPELKAEMKNWAKITCVFIVIFIIYTMVSGAVPLSVSKYILIAIGVAYLGLMFYSNYKIDQKFDK